MARLINQAGVDLIKRFEGFRAEAYLDPIGIPTIGYGHINGVTKRDVRNGRTITEAQAEQFLREDLAVAEAAVERLISVPLNENQFSALVSFTFNLGAGNLQSSTLRRKLNSGDYGAVPAEMARWVKAGGQTLAGLVRRRGAEGDLFMTSVGAAPLEEPVPRGQRIETVASGPDAGAQKSYLRDPLDLQHGSVDDHGDAAYVRLTQNVPDGYVLEMQNDIASLGFGSGMTTDGAFGDNTLAAVEKFQKAAGLARSGVVDQPTRDAITLWLRHGHTKSSPPGTEDEQPAAVQGGNRLISPRVPHFSQGDPRWADRILGRSSSIARQGCAISSIAMILHFYGRHVNPGTLDAFLDSEGGYAGNSVVWSVAGRCRQGRKDKLKYASKAGSEEKLRKILAERVKKNLPTMVRVDYGVDSDITYNHFVLCVGVTGDGDLIMNDPATSRGDGYANPDNENLIGRTTRKQGYRIVKIDYYEPA